jgi:hypothetical protein
MSTEQPWGAPAEPGPAQKPAPRWSGTKTAAAVGIAVAIAAGGGAAIWAATSNDSGTARGPGGGFGGPGGQGGGPGFAPPDGPGFGRGGGPGLIAGALHGEFVIADGSTDLLQTGKVTAVSATSIDLTSTDGYAKKYTINSATVIDNGRSQVSDIKTGDEVTVIAKKTDASALSLTDRAVLPQPGRPGR